MNLRTGSETLSGLRFNHPEFPNSSKEDEEKALVKFEKYRRERGKNYVSDFDREMKKILKTKKF